MQRVLDGWNLRNSQRLGLYKCKHAVFVGEQSGLLTVTAIYDNGTVDCKCQCGNTINVSRRKLLYNQLKSCGCLRRNRYSREDVLNEIESYKRRSGVDPFIEDLANELNMGMTAVYKYRDEYNLGPFLNWQYSSRGEAELASLYPG